MNNEENNAQQNDISREDTPRERIASAERLSEIFERQARRYESESEGGVRECVS